MEILIAVALFLMVGLMAAGVAGIFAIYASRQQ